jgi:hypothetical protein
MNFVYFGISFALISLGFVLICGVLPWLIASARRNEEIAYYYDVISQMNVHNYNAAVRRAEGGGYVPPPPKPKGQLRVFKNPNKQDPK